MRGAVRSAKMVRGGLLTHILKPCVVESIATVACKILGVECNDNLTAFMADVYLCDCAFFLSLWMNEIFDGGSSEVESVWCPGHERLLYLCSRGLCVSFR